VGSLTDNQRSIVVGSLLGDGSMRCKTNALLEINHSSHQQGYVDWKYSQLENLVRTAPKLRRGNGSRIAYRFTTLSLPQLTPIYREFYRDGKKIVPKLEITPLSLAVWFMDDGCKSRTSVYLNTQQFEMASQLALTRMLHQQFNLKTTLNRDKIYYRLRIAVASIGRFKQVVEPYVLPEFRYKLPT
jgi:recombination protein RecA